VASLLTMMKPDTGGKATGKHSPDLPGWLGAARVERSAEELLAIAPAEARIGGAGKLATAKGNP
jgi:hypothetical protein